MVYITYIVNRKENTGNPMEKERWREMTQKEYGKLVKELSPKSPIWKDCLKAFVIGGLICTIGQGIMNIYKALELEE